ncbi:MAG: gliding motility-associated C-terminal domain-containing protein [Elusimicrobiota bacterium]
MKLKILSIVVLYFLLTLPLTLNPLPCLHSAPLQVTDLVTTDGFRRVTLNWSAPYDASASTPASQYEIRVSTYRILVSTLDWADSSTSTGTGHPYRILINTSTSAGFWETYAVTGLTNGKLYYFAIRSSTDGINLSGMDSSSPEPAAEPQNNQPEPFSVISPKDGNLVFSSTPTLIWNAANPGYTSGLLLEESQGDYISRYTVYYTTDSSLLNPTIKTGVGTADNITTTFFVTPALMENTTYYWRVRAYDSENAQKDSSYDSSANRFIVNAINEPPVAVTPLAPPNTGYVSKSETIDFDWSDSSDSDPGFPGNFTYTLMFSTTGPKETNPGSFWAAVSCITASNYQFISSAAYTLASPTTAYLLENATYWWYIATVDSTSLTASATYSWRFLVDRFEDAPTNYYQVYPVTGTVVYTPTPTFIWGNPPFDPDPGDILQFEVTISTTPDVTDYNSVFPYYIKMLDYPLNTLTTGPLLENTSYWWRVAVKDRVWSYSIFTSTEMFIVDGVITPPASFNLQFPQNQSSTSTLKPYFDWSDSSTQEPKRTFTYTILLSTDDFASYTSSAGLTSSSYQPSANFLDEKKYWWKVKAVDNRLAETYASQTTYWFIINTTTEPPNAFNLLVPTNTAVMNPMKLYFDWDNSTVTDLEDSIQSYTIQFSTSSDFVTSFSSAGLTVSSWTAPYSFTNDTTYYWRVNAFGLYGSTCSFQTWTFITSATFNLVTPLNATDVNPLKVTFDWEDYPNPGSPVTSVNYDLFFTSYSDFSTSYSFSGITYSSFTLPYSLENNVTYYWRVRAVQSPMYESSASSMTFSNQPFWTIITRSSFNLLSPLNTTTTSYLKVSYDWTDFVDPDLTDAISFKYELQYTADGSFASYISSGGLSSSSLAISSALINNTIYFWRVKAVVSPVAPGANADIYSVESYWWFRAENLSPSGFSVTAPVSNSIVTSSTLTVNWNAATDTEGDSVVYTVIYSTDSSFNVKVTSSSISNLSLQMPASSMIENARYYLKVEARDVWQNLIQTPTIYFYVNAISQAPSTFTLISPQSGTGWSYPTLVWEGAFDLDPSDVVSYDLWYSTDSSFVFKEVISGITTTYYYISQELSGYSTYFWKVKAYGSSDLQSVYTFSNSTFSFYIVAQTPGSPLNLKGVLSDDRSAITFSWSAATRNTDGTDMSNLSGYRLYRSDTFAGLETASYFAAVSSYVLTYTETNITGSYFYSVRAVNKFNVVSPMSQSVYIDPSALSNYKVFWSETKDVTIRIPKTSYDAMLSSVGSVNVTITRVPSQESGSVYRVYDITVKESTFEVRTFSELLLIDFDYSGISVSDIQQLGVSKYNGVEWIRLPSELDRVEKVLKIKTKSLSKFRVELLSASGEFTLYNWPTKARIITPDGDGRNDVFEFYFTNPLNNAVSGRIYSFTGDYVADISVDTSQMVLSWDGKDSAGSKVAPGIYIYQIKVEGALSKIINGTVVVAR